MERAVKFSKEFVKPFPIGSRMDNYDVGRGVGPGPLGRSFRETPFFASKFALWDAEASGTGSISSRSVILPVRRPFSRMSNAFP
jgi:hypothetical protein